MKENDKYIGKESLDVVLVKKLIDKPQKKVVYSFEGEERSFSLLEDIFLELYRPYSRIDEVMDEKAEDIES